MNDKQVQDLVRGQFMNQMVFRIMDETKAAKAQGKQVKTPLICNIIAIGFVLFWGILLGGTVLLCLFGLILEIFD